MKEEVKAKAEIIIKELDGLATLDRIEALALVMDETRKMLDDRVYHALKEVEIAKNDLQTLNSFMNIESLEAASVQAKYTMKGSEFEKLIKRAQTSPESWVID